MKKQTLFFQSSGYCFYYATEAIIVTRVEIKRQLDIYDIEMIMSDIATRMSNTKGSIKN